MEVESNYCLAQVKTLPGLLLNTNCFILQWTLYGTMCPRHLPGHTRWLCQDHAVLSKGCVNFLTRNFNNLAVTHQQPLKRQLQQQNTRTAEQHSRNHHTCQLLQQLVAAVVAQWHCQVADATGGLCVPICTCQVPSGQVYIKYNKYLPQFMQRQWPAIRLLPVSLR